LLIIKFNEKNESHQGFASKYAEFNIDANLYPEVIWELTGPINKINTDYVFDESL